MNSLRRNKYLLKGNSCFLLVNVKNGLKKLDFNRALPTPDKIPVNTGWITRYMNHMTLTNAVNGRSYGNLQRNLNTYHRIRVQQYILSEYVFVFRERWLAFIFSATNPKKSQKFSDTLQNVSCYKKAKCEFKIEVTRDKSSGLLPKKSF